MAGSLPQLRRPVSGALSALRAACLMIAVAALDCCGAVQESGVPSELLLFNYRPCAATPLAPPNSEFSSPAKVTITGYSGHAMEPFITRNGTYLFFNNLNDGVDTCLHYASRVSDTQFTYQGKISGVNGTPPHLDAVASMTQAGGRFYFVSTRDYPASYLNLQTGTFSGGTVSGVAPVGGDFYIQSPGWIVMDAEVSSDGNTLYFVNAHFSGGSMPDASDIGIAAYSAGSFYRSAASSAVMAAVNTCDCLEYAPSITVDGLELFFTRYSFSQGRADILIAKRSSTTEAFRAPERIDALGGLVEAPSITADGHTLYYHYLDAGTYTIYKVSRP